MPFLPSGVVTFLLTDVEGSTRLWERFPEAMSVALARHDALVREGVARHGGSLIKSRGEGDSAFAVFARAPGAVAAALALQRDLAGESWPGDSVLRVRMALHAGEAELRDGDYYGSAVNRCARLRALAHGGQVLLSQAARDLVQGNMPEGAGLRSLGPHHLPDLQSPEEVYQLVHHGLRGEFPPLRSQSGIFPTAEEALAGDALRSGPGPGGRLGRRVAPPRLALVHSPGREPDARLAGLLEAELRAIGCVVSVDRHAAEGLSWAREVARRIVEADIVIPLLSRGSTRSELVWQELALACGAALARAGHPRILPVRVAFLDGLWPSMPAPLASIEPLLWESPRDDAALLTGVRRCVVWASDSESPFVPGRAAETWPWNEVWRGIVQPVGPASPAIPPWSAAAEELWIARPAERQLRTHLARNDGIVVVQGAARMGKTSLLSRAAGSLQRSGWRAVLTDLRWVAPAVLASMESFCRFVADQFAAQLDLQPVSEDWDPARSPVANLERVLKTQLLGDLETRLFWAIDNLDLVYELALWPELVGMFGEWQKDRAYDPVFGPWQRLSIAVTAAHDPRGGPGADIAGCRRVMLDDLGAEEFAGLASRFGSLASVPGLSDRWFEELGGSAHLLHHAAEALREHGGAGHDLKDDPLQTLLDVHLRRLLVVLAADDTLVDGTRAVLRAEPCPEPAFGRLRATGVVLGESPAAARVRCPLYAAYLTRQLL